MKNIRVWDAPQRIGHWLLVLAFVLAYATGDSEEGRLIHILAGGAVAGVVLFRIVWGVIGSTYARFGNFVRSPIAAARYMRSLFSGKPEHFAGHNPAGGLAIVVMLMLALGATATGWAAYQDRWGDWLKELHEFFVNGLLVVALVHVAGVVVGSAVHKENLPRAMFTGKKLGSAEDLGISSNRWAVVLLLAVVVAVVMWAVQR